MKAKRFFSLFAVAAMVFGLGLNLTSCKDKDKTPDDQTVVPDDEDETPDVIPGPDPATLTPAQRAAREACLNGTAYYVYYASEDVLTFLGNKVVASYSFDGSMIENDWWNAGVTNAYPAEGADVFGFIGGWQALGAQAGAGWCSGGLCTRAGDGFPENADACIAKMQEFNAMVDAINDDFDNFSLVYALRRTGNIADQHLTVATGQGEMWINISYDAVPADGEWHYYVLPLSETDAEFIYMDEVSQYKYFLCWYPQTAEGAETKIEFGPVMIMKN